MEEIFAKIDNSVWLELESIEDINSYKRQLQNLHIDMYRQILEKYGITTNKDIKSIVFKGIDSIMGDPAKTTIEFLDDFTRLEKTLQKEGKVKPK